MFQKNFFLIYLLFFILSYTNLNSQINCPTDTILIINTGYNPVTGGIIPIGQNDPFWIVISDPILSTLEPRPATTISKHPAWSNPFPNSQWIAVYSSYANNTNGIYEYQRCFCIEREGRIRIRLQVLADDTVGIFLNNIYLGGSTPSSFSGQFQIPLKIDTVISLNAGRHCFKFVVGNVGAIAHGLNVSGTLFSLAPTPIIKPDTCCTPGFIHGQKINDLNCNGKLDYGEPVLQNWQIVVQGIQGTNFSDTVLTGSDGYYSLQVPPGCYNVFEIPQQGWTQTFPSGIQQICVNYGQVVHLNFLNCQNPPCDTIGQIELDTNCCQFKVPVFNLATGGGPLQQINWQILNNSGTMESISVMSSCPSTLVPPNPYNTTSGTIQFSGGGCTTNPTLIMEANSTTASGIITIAFTFIHKGQICYDTLNLKCPRAPLVRCDRLTVAPFTWPGLNLSGRTFTITNLKQPSSKIKEVIITLTPDPFPSDPNFKWNGGGLLVDGFPRGWGITNSGTPYYSRISLACQTGTTAPQGSAANNQIKFNLGVDYTLGWTGNVILKVIHCDGDTCELIYNNWCAKPPKLCLTPNPIFMDTLIKPMITVGSAKFKITRNAVRYIAIELDKESSQKAQLLGALAGIAEKGKVIASAKTLEYSTDMEERFGKNSSVLELPDYFNELGQEKDCNILVFFETDSVVKFDVILFDENVNPIGFDSFVASQPVSSVKLEWEDYQDFELLKLSPNPSKDLTSVEFFIPKEGNISLQIFDVLGTKVKILETGWRSFGLHKTDLDTKELTSGSYIIVLTLPDGRIVRKPFVITK